MKNKQYEDEIVFVVGYSRSGTKMMSDILEKSNIILRPPEVHFFGTIYDQSTKDVEVLETIRTISKIQEKGINFAYPLTSTEIQELIRNSFPDKVKTPALEIYTAYFNYVAKKNNKVRFCDATPRNIYYLDFLLEQFPKAKFIFMLRDPRDNVLSQKVKYKNYLKSDKIEALRLYFNYNPLTISKMWKNSYKKYLKNASNDRIKLVKYEELTKNPADQIKEICQFISIDFKSEMADHVRGGNSNKWKSGLTKCEISSVEDILEQEMKKNNYEIVYGHPTIICKFFNFMKLVLKAPFIFIFNFSRAKNIKSDFLKRFK